MASSSRHEACLRLAEDLEQHWSADEDLNNSHRALLSSLRSVENGVNDSLAKIWALMPDLSNHLWEILQTGKPEEFRTAILSTLAYATREEPFWRPLFGLAEKPDYAINLRQRKRETPPDSILEVARRIVAGVIKVSSSQQLRSALRIVANCCADNNVNRSIMINRDGIEDLLEELLRQRRECDLAIPVLYNICIDYDEPALDGYRRPWAPLPQTQAPGGKDASELKLSAAEQRLGTYWFLYEDKTSFEILLDARDQAEHCAGTIADLIELGSRVALFGAQHFVQENDGRDPDEVREVDTTAAIIRLLLSKGIQLAQVDTDCRLSMCQALLNFLSQADIQAIVINTEGALWSLIHLPYPEDYDSLPDEEKENLLVYQKAFRKIIYEISAANDFALQMTEQSSLMRNCLGALDSYSQGTPLAAPVDGLVASIYVLVANGITTKEQAQSLLRSSDIASFLCLQFPRLSDPEVLLPAIGLATRLALFPEGQDALESILHDVTSILDQTAREVDAIGTEMRRHACVLIRLLIKGRPGSIQRLKDPPANLSWPVEPGVPKKPGFTMREALSLFHRTQDAQTKLEIGRLSIEVLRLLATPNTDSSQTHSTGQTSGTQTTATSEEREDGLTRLFGPHWPLPLVSVAATISCIITHPQPQQPSSRRRPEAGLEGEAWFGLGLLSTYPSTHASIRAVFVANGYQLLNRLREIVAHSSSSPPVASPEPSVPANAGASPAPQTDPRVENIKVLIVRLMQRQSGVAGALNSLTVNESNSRDSTTSIDTEADKKVQSGLEAAAAELGLDWVMV